MSVAADPGQVVYIVDDDAAVRDSLCWLLESIKLRVRCFGSAEAFLDTLPADPAGCLVLDVRMPGISGPELMDLLAERQVHLPILFLSAHGDVPLAVRAMKAGAVDFLQKPCNNQQFLERVHYALQIDRRNRSEHRREADLAARLAGLTARERQILDQVVAGRSNKEVGRALGISYKTVEAHRGRLMRKMGASSFAELLQMMLGRPDNA